MINQISEDELYTISEALRNLGWDDKGYDEEDVAFEFKSPDGRWTFYISMGASNADSPREIESTLRDYGVFQIYRSFTLEEDSIDVSHLEKHFEEPAAPTPEERSLFELEFGCEYPIQEAI